MSSNPLCSSEESDANLIPGSWLAPTWLAAALARGGAHIRLIHLATAEDRAFVHARHRLLEALPPFIDTTEETRPVRAGFTADLAYLRLDCLDPDALELGGRFADLLPTLWVMAGAIGALPTATAKRSTFFPRVVALKRRKPASLRIRNLDRKSWSLGIPCEFEGQRRPLFPDFIVVRRSGEHYVADLLEPHRGEDSVAKAKGLAQFADLHGNYFGRIEMIRVEGAELRRLDFNDHRIREAIFPIQAHDELTRLFDTSN